MGRSRSGFIMWEAILATVHPQKFYAALYTCYAKDTLLKPSQYARHAFIVRSLAPLEKQITCQSYNKKPKNEQDFIKGLLKHY